MTPVLPCVSISNDTVCALTASLLGSLYNWNTYKYTSCYWANPDELGYIYPECRTSKKSGAFVEWTFYNDSMEWE
jgi:hypothetical protein